MTMKLTTGKRIAETSSKGNQEKWREGGRWYKLDLFGYEGLAETVVSRLLEHTNLGELGFSFVPYRMEQLEVHGRKRTGCSSPDFLREGEAILTLAELFRKGVGPDWQAQVSRLPNLASRVRWMADTTRQLTGLDRFGEYLTALFEADMLFGNEDRHLNNCLLYTSPSPRDISGSRMPSSALKNFFFNDTATTEIYTRSIVGSVRCV